MANKGAYGKLHFTDDGWAIKRADMYDDMDRTVVGNNLTEAVLGLSVCRGMPHVIRMYDARVEGGKNIETTMEKYDTTLHQFVRDTRYADRMKGLRRILRGLLIGLHALHMRRLAHCDLKPANILLRRGDPVIIDLGSTRFVMRVNYGERMEVVCTYAFSAPESLMPGARPTFAHDAYSLGAVLHFCIYKVYLSDGLARAESREQALMAYATSRLEIPNQCPELVDPRVFEAMRGLLNPDPAKRTRISDLLAEFVEPTAPMYRLKLNVDKLNLEDDTGRAADVDVLYEVALSPGSFPLAVSIRDRAHAKGKTELTACALLAHMTLYPDSYGLRPSRPVMRAMEGIIERLDFILYSDTAEWILRVNHGILWPCLELLRDAIKDSHGDTMLAVRLYLKGM